MNSFKNILFNITTGKCPVKYSLHTMYKCCTNGVGSESYIILLYLIYIIVCISFFRLTSRGFFSCSMYTVPPPQLPC